MSKYRCGKSTYIFRQKPVIQAWASVAGKRESEGPMGRLFDYTCAETMFGQKSWELAEKRMQELCLQYLLKKAGHVSEDIDVVFSGDLLNQCIGSSFSLRNRNIPQLGLYGACSTMAESLLLAAAAVDADFVDHTVALTSSHFASSERQYRFPLGYGGQRSPTAQWTVTGSGAVWIASSGNGPRVTACTIGTVNDLGIKDANNMGSAMAPAALHTIMTHFHDTGTAPGDYDLIVTGDLGQLGKDILLYLSQKEGLSLGGKLKDCGCMVFDNTRQDVHSGGSGCGCSAIVLCSGLLNDLAAGKFKKILFCGTGALLSPTSVQQGLPIPGICHAVVLEGGN